MFHENVPDMSHANRSWHIRMASVIRQFEALTREELMSELGPVTIHGFIQQRGRTMLTVCLDFESCKVTSIEPDQILPFV